MGDADLDTSAKSECAKARFRIGFLALHNFQFDLALEMFEQAEEDEKAEIGRSYPMAMWGATMATMQILWQYSDCVKGKEFLFLRDEYLNRSFGEIISEKLVNRR